MITGKRLYSLVFTTILSFLAACTTGVGALTITPSPAPPSTNEPPLSTRVSLSTVSMKEEGAAPKYSITVQMPRLAGNEDKRVVEFNRQVQELVQDEINYFRENILAHMPITPITNGSFLEVNYTLVFQGGDLWAFKFNFFGYTDGAAHPFRYSMTMNYDLERGHALALADLFAEDSSYLKAISSFCIAELSRRDIGFYGGFEQGAEPTKNNYRNWNITMDGLLITFDEYQVAPYAAGQQTITVPYNELRPLVNPQGPLALVLR